jgi:hypothetical protein
MHIGMRLLVVFCGSLADLRGANRTSSAPNWHPAMMNMNIHIRLMILYLTVHTFLNLIHLCISKIRGLEEQTIERVLG